MKQTKSFSISKSSVKKAYQIVRANKGASGVDKISLRKYEENLGDNLYKVWNRMSSGSYFPPAVRMVEIPKKQGGKRSLGIPTVGDRVAQMVVKRYLEPKVEPYFHVDSYGYRPGKSAHDALEITRQRCWEYDWLIDLDIKEFFDSMDHELIMEAVKRREESKWVHLYIERWLKAPVEVAEGKQRSREKGTPQGGVISPLLANLYLHYAFDEWMKRNYPEVKFARYADDIVVHCRTREEAERLKEQIGRRLEECKLQMHPEKTKIVYCKDSNRKGDYKDTKFDFLGYTFRSRSSRNRRGNLFVSFSPAVSNSSMRMMKAKIKSWKLHMRSGIDLEEIAERINPIIRGWINYYGRFHGSELAKVFLVLNMRIIKWLKRKYKRFRRSWHRTINWFNELKRSNQSLFAHW